MNKSERVRRKRSEKLFTIFKGKLGLYDNIMDFFIVTRTVNILVFCFRVIVMDDHLRNNN